MSIDWKKDSNNLILIIINWLKKIVYYKSVKVTIDAPGVVEVIIDIVIQ